MSRTGLIRDLHPAGAGRFWLLSILALVLIVMGWGLGAAVATVLALLAFCHYRLAARPDGNSAAIFAPADGRVLLSGRATPPGDRDTAYRIRLRGRLTDSRMIQSPVTGTVRQAGLRDGIVVEQSDGARVHIALPNGWFGLRGRIFTFAGQTVAAGDPLAVAAPGGVTDMYLPFDSGRIAPGRSVLSGQALR